MTNLITLPVQQQIDQWLTKYPPEQKRSAVLVALRLVQEQNGGWLSEPLLEAVAEYLELPKTAVFEVATFYNMFNLKPMGKHKIAVCNSISCMLCGAKKIITHLENRLGIKVGETTADGMFTLVEAECLAACVGAPMLQIDDREYHENLTEEKVDVLLEALKQGEKSA